MMKYTLLAAILVAITSCQSAPETKPVTPTTTPRPTTDTPETPPTTEPPMTPPTSEPPPTVG